jgi:ammonia channel protein AmtB
MNMPYRNFLTIFVLLACGFVGTMESWAGFILYMIGSPHFEIVQKKYEVSFIELIPFIVKMATFFALIVCCCIWISWGYFWMFGLGTVSLTIQNERVL